MLASRLTCVAPASGERHVVRCGDDNVQRGVLLATEDGDVAMAWPRLPRSNGGRHSPDVLDRRSGPVARYALPSASPWCVRCSLCLVVPVVLRRRLRELDSEHSHRAAAVGRLLAATVLCLQAAVPDAGPPCERPEVAPLTLRRFV